MPRGSQPKYLAIYADLRRRILDGRLQPSEKLPPQQQLAAEYGVTVMTLRQAVSELEAEGLIWVSRGRGSFVVDQPLRYR
ncbi:MAG: GntR family transcriptional regulator, partial [Acidimicrobiia bacterium]|nr:GntR family transcriptional regulator [Acidimicrobiia bacterium]